MVALTIAVGGCVPYYKFDVADGVLAPLFKVLAMMFMPGLNLSMMVGGNAHNISLGLGVIIKWLLYSALLLLVTRRWLARAAKD
jgi:hypothetical protein